MTLNAVFSPSHDVPFDVTTATLYWHRCCLLTPHTDARKARRSTRELDQRRLARESFNAGGTSVPVDVSTAGSRLSGSSRHSGGTGLGTVLAQALQADSSAAQQVGSPKAAVKHLSVTVEEDPHATIAVNSVGHVALSAALSPENPHFNGGVGVPGTPSKKVLAFKPLGSPLAADSPNAKAEHAPGHTRNRLSNAHINVRYNPELSLHSPRNSVSELPSAVGATTPKAGSQPVNGDHSKSLDDKLAAPPSAQDKPGAQHDHSVKVEATPKAAVTPKKMSPPQGGHVLAPPKDLLEYSQDSSGSKGCGCVVM